MGAARHDRAYLREHLPDWLVVYVFLGIADLAFTLTALRLGAREANPVLDGALDVGLFEFVKISLTLLILCVAYKYRHLKLVENIMQFANAFMAALIVYHVAWLSILVF
jgi:hypothetical protein